MNEMAALLNLRDFMDSDEGWGRAEGRAVYLKLVQFVESQAGKVVVRVSFKGVKRADISFVSETVVELAARYLRHKGICLVDVGDADVMENIDAAAQRKGIPLVTWLKGSPTLLGLKPKAGTDAALKFALRHPEMRTSEFSETVPEMSMANVSMKFKQLYEQGFLLRREDTADSGGKEFVYLRIG